MRYKAENMYSTLACTKERRQSWEHANPHILLLSEEREDGEVQVVGFRDMAPLPGESLDSNHRYRQADNTCQRRPPRRSQVKILHERCRKGCIP